MSVDFLVTTDLQPFATAQIEANFAEAKDGLTQMLAPYRGMLVTQDAIADAKNDLAKIRKIKKRIDEQRIEVKRIYSAPLAEFERKCKELTAVCAEAEENLAAQITQYDAQRRAEKLDGLRKYYDEKIAGTVAEAYLKWEDVFSEKWGNVTYAECNAQAEIDTAIRMTNEDVATIKALGSEYEIALLAFYRQCHSLAQVISKNTEYVAMTAQREKEKAVKTPAPAAEEAPAPVTVETREEPQPDAQIITIDFRCSTTKAKFIELGQYMRSHGIQYGKIPKENK